MTFLGGIWRVLVGIKDALALLFLLLFFGGLAAALSLRGATVKVPDGAALVLDLEGALVDQATPLSPLAAVDGGLPPEIEVRDVTRALEAAAQDRAVKAVVLDLDGFLGGGLANLEAVGRSLQRVRRAGKPVLAYATVYFDDSWYLAAHANEVWVNPLGTVALSGPGATNLYFRNALQKLKLDVEVFRVGTFKSAVEPFTRTEASPEAEAADQALVDDLWRAYRDGIKAARPSLDLDALVTGWPARVQSAGPDLATLAREAGLVDRVGPRLEFARRLRQLVGEGDDPDRADDFKRIGLPEYLAARLRDADREAQVAIVHVAGPIVDGEAPEGQAGARSVADLVERAIADDEVKALVLRISSPGGSATAADVIREAALAAKAAGKPVVASLGPVAASGGYWVATAADRILAERSSITGSIGVFGIVPIFGRTLAELGITSDGVGTTPYSRQPNLIEGLNAPARDLIQASVENVYRRFVNLVAQARRLPPFEVERIAEGRVWSGLAAERLKLVDSFGGLDTAVAEAGRLAKLEGVIKAKEIRQPRSLFDQLLAGRTWVRSPVPDPLGLPAHAARLRLAVGVRSALEAATGPWVQARCLACAAFAAPTNPPSRALARSALR